MSYVFEREDGHCWRFEEAVFAMVVRGMPILCRWRLAEN